MLGLKKPLLRRQSSRFLLAFAALFCWQASAACAPQPETITTLVPGDAIVRQLNGGDTHVFQVPLLEGQYLCVAVEQRGIDVELRLSAPNQQRLIAMDTLNGTQGPEVAAVIATQPGQHRIEIVSPSQSAPAGTYEVKIRALRPATEPDQRWLTAQQFYAAGKFLSEGTSAEAQEQAAQKFAEALRIWQVLDDRLMVAHTLHYLVSVYRDIGQTQHALVYSGYALELLRASGQQREAAHTLTTLAIILNELGELPKALEYYEQSLVQWRSFQDTYGEARTLINLGLVNSQLGEPRVALGYYDQALAVWQKLGEQFQAAETLTRIGTAYYRLDEWQNALEFALQAQGLYRALANKRGEAAVLNNMGLVYERLGEAGKALDYYRQALAFWRTLGNRREEAEILSNIGLAEAQQENAAQALTSYQLSLKLFREAGDRRGEALVLQRLGDLQANSNDASTALEFYNQALPLLRTAGDGYRESIVLLSIAELHLRQNNPTKAKGLLTPALTTLQAIGNRSNEAQALYGLARAERASGNLSAAQQQIEAALAQAEAVRAEVGSQQLRASYLASVHKYYELNLDILMRLHQAQPSAGYDALALQASERARARSLVELLTEARANLRAGIDKALLEQSNKLIQQLNAKAQRQLQLTAQRSNAAQLQTLKQEISALEDEYNQVEARIRQSNPQYAALTQPQPLSLTAIQQQLDADSLLLEYSLGEERSWLWAVTKNSITSFPLPKRAQIEQAALQFRDLLTARSQRQRGETTRQREARILQADTQLPTTCRYAKPDVLEPRCRLLENQRLIVVADGALQYVPFGALPVPREGRRGKGERKGAKRKPPPLPFCLVIVRHEIITLPSASTLAVLRLETANRPACAESLSRLCRSGVHTGRGD